MAPGQYIFKGSPGTCKEQSGFRIADSGPPRKAKVLQQKEPGKTDHTASRVPGSLAWRGGLSLQPLLMRDYAPRDAGS